MSTNKVIKTVLIAIAVLLISIFIYKSTGSKTYEFIVQANTCEDTTYLIILNTYLESIDVENHDPLVIPTKIFDKNSIIEPNKFYKVTGKEKKSGEMKFSIELTDKTYHEKMHLISTYRKFSAEREHTFCGMEHFKDYHTKRHILQADLLGPYIGAPNDTLALATSSTNFTKYYLYKISNTSTEHVVLDEALHEMYPTLNTNLLYVLKDYRTKFFIEVEGNIIGVYKIAEISNTHSH